MSSLRISTTISCGDKFDQSHTCVIPVLLPPTQPALLETANSSVGYCEAHGDVGKQRSITIEGNLYCSQCLSDCIKVNGDYIRLLVEGEK